MHLEAVVGQGVGKAKFRCVAVGQRHKGHPGPALGKAPGKIPQHLPPGGIPVQTALQGFGRIFLLGGNAARTQKTKRPVPHAYLADGHNESCAEVG